MKKKWIYIAAGIIGFIGAIVGLYFYVKKAMSKVGKAIDDTFDIEQKANQSKKVHWIGGQPVFVSFGEPISMNGKINKNNMKYNIKWDHYESTTGDPWYPNINTVNMFDGDDGR